MNLFAPSARVVPGAPRPAPWSVLTFAHVGLFSFSQLGKTALVGATGMGGRPRYELCTDKPIEQPIYRSGYDGRHEAC